MSERYRVVASFDGWGQAGVYIGDTRFCIAPSKENAERIAAALNSVEGIATQSNAQAGVVPEGMMLVPIDPPFPKKWIAKGVRTENEKQSVVWLGYTDEGGGWHQWCTHKNSAKLFDTEEAAIRNAKSCTGPWYNEPAKSSITAEQVEGPQAHKYRAALAAVKGVES